MKKRVYSISVEKKKKRKKLFHMVIVSMHIYEKGEDKP